MLGLWSDERTQASEDESQGCGQQRCHAGSTGKLAVRAGKPGTGARGVGWKR